MKTIYQATETIYSLDADEAADVLQKLTTEAYRLHPDVAYVHMSCRFVKYSDRQTVSVTLKDPNQKSWPLSPGLTVLAIVWALMIAWAIVGL